MSTTTSTSTSVLPPTSRTVSSSSDVLRRAVWLVPALGALAGLLVFETLIYVGVRRCRYANPAA